MSTQPASHRAFACRRIWLTELSRFWNYKLKCIATAIVASAALLPVQNATGAANLEMKHITWDVIGLDHNMPDTDGPEDFPVAVRVKNTGNTAAPNVSISLKLEEPGGNQHINIIGKDTITTPSLAAGQMADFYFQVKIERPTMSTDGYFSELDDPSTVRKYWFEASIDGATPTNTQSQNRQLYVEKILSQNRNSVAPVLVVNNPEDPFIPGEIRTFTLYSDTATGYDQQETGINFPTDIFQILSVRAYYTDPDCTCQIINQNIFHEDLVTSTGKYVTNKIYVDACGWITDPNEPGYMESNASCGDDENNWETETGKVGGTIITFFQVKVVAPIVDQVILSYLVHDHSGSSFHYNFEANIFEINPTNILVAKSAPLQPIEAKSDFTYMITVMNNSSNPANDVVLSDTLPSCVDVVSATPSPVDISASPLIWNLGTLAPGASVDIEVEATAGCNEGTCMNTASVSTIDQETNYEDNESTAQITIVDTTPPDLECPDDKTMECPGDISVETNGSPSASDACGVTVDHEDTTSATCGDSYVVFRVWTATDDAGNESSCTQTLTVEDTTAPSLSEVEDTEVECTGTTSPAVTGEPDASDTCGDVTVTYTDGPLSNGCGNTGSFTRTWTAKDECGNSASTDQVITIVDKTAPTLSNVDDVEVECTSTTSPAVTGEPEASDTCGDVTVTYNDGPLSDGCGNTGSFTRTWTAKDECGNSASTDQVITIVDKTAPTLSNVDDVEVECTSTTSPGVTGEPEASDTCGDVTVTYTDGPLSDGCGNTGSFTRTWTAKDECNNSVSTEQLITIVDTTPPSLQCPANIIADAPPLGQTCTVVTYPDPVVSDTCGDVTVRFDPPSGTCFECGVTSEVVVTATDDCNNSTSCTFTVTVGDCQKPTCGFTQGYWKNHPEAWPVDNLDLGNINYSKSELLTILNKPVKKSIMLALAHQLIAAKLNIANGSDSSCISATIDAADELIGNKSVLTGSLKNKQASPLIKTLDDYNNGRLCISHCDDLEPLPLSTTSITKKKQRR